MVKINKVTNLHLPPPPTPQTRDGAVYQEGRDVVMINEWTDRIYQNTPQEHIITNVVSGRKMRIQKFNLPDTGEQFGCAVESVWRCRNLGA